MSHPFQHLRLPSCTSPFSLTVKRTFSTNHHFFCGSQNSLTVRLKILEDFHRNVIALFLNNLKTSRCHTTHAHYVVCQHRRAFLAIVDQDCYFTYKQFIRHIYQNRVPVTWSSWTCTFISWHVYVRLSYSRANHSLQRLQWFVRHFFRSSERTATSGGTLLFSRDNRELTLS